MKELFARYWNMDAAELVCAIEQILLSVGVAVGIVFVIVLIFNKRRDGLFF